VTEAPAAQDPGWARAPGEVSTYLTCMTSPP